MKFYSYLVTPQFVEQAIRHELDVLPHEFTVHSDHVNRQRLGQELLLNDDGFPDDLGNSGFLWFVGNVLEHQTSEITMKALGEKIELNSYL